MAEGDFCFVTFRKYFVTHCYIIKRKYTYLCMQKRR